MQEDALIRLYLDEHIKIAKAFPVDDVVKLFNKVYETYKVEGRVFVFGNGGASDVASHFASDLAIHPFVTEDKAKPIYIGRFSVTCLNNSVSMITRIANDMGYENVFYEQLECYFINAKDLVIGISNSGNSPNVVKALDFANCTGVPTALIGGGKDSKAGNIADIVVSVKFKSNFPGQTGANNNAFNIEDFQHSVCHMITGLMRRAVNGN